MVFPPFRVQTKLPQRPNDGHQPQRFFCAVGCMPVLGSLPALR